MSNLTVKAYVLAIVKKGTEHRVAEALRENEEDVVDVLVTYGVWDLVIRIETSSMEKLDKIVTVIRQIPEIEQTHTLIGFKNTQIEGP